MEPNQFSTQPQIELNEEFLAELETEEVLIEREAKDMEPLSLHYVHNAIDLLNESYNFLKYDPNVDVVKDQYEGGFKLWEGTNDLLHLLYNHGEKFFLNNTNVMDLGCGSGLVGIYCMKAYNLASVCFQDYNLEVLNFATVSNIIKNGLVDQMPKCRFLAGDWSETAQKIANNVNDVVTKLHTESPVLTSQPFDVIFMSEVLYNVDNYPKLGNIINTLLSENGFAIISSKLYYFGVSGSVDEFKEFMEANYPGFTIKTMLEINDKKSNKREIFAIGKNLPF